MPTPGSAQAAQWAALRPPLDAPIPPRSSPVSSPRLQATAAPTQQQQQQQQPQQQQPQQQQPQMSSESRSPSSSPYSRQGMFEQAREADAAAASSAAGSSSRAGDDLGEAGQLVGAGIALLRCTPIFCKLLHMRSTITAADAS